MVLHQLLELLRRLGCNSIRAFSVIALDELKGVGFFAGDQHFFVGGVGLSVEDVLKNGVVEDDGLLHHEGDDSSQVVQIDVLDVHVIEKDFTSVNIVESHHQIDESALTTTGLSHKGDAFSGVDDEVESSMNEVFLSGWVSEPNVSELDLSFDVLDVLP